MITVGHINFTHIATAEPKVGDILPKRLKFFRRFHAAEHGHGVAVAADDAWVFAKILLKIPSRVVAPGRDDRIKIG